MCKVVFPLEPKALSKTLDNGLLFLENITAFSSYTVRLRVFLCPPVSPNALLVGAYIHAFAYTLALHSF